MDKQSSWECEGATMLDHDGYPCYHEAMDNLLMYCKNFRVEECCPVAGAEILRETSGVASLNAHSPDVGPKLDYVSGRREIVDRLPEHLRCVLPGSEGAKQTLSSSALEEATKLILDYEDCFVGASGKVGWTD